MKTRPSKVREVFAELRSALGSEVPAGQLLRLAAKLVAESEPHHERIEEWNVGPREAFDVVPLDRAFADGGWRLRASEHLFEDTHFEEDPIVRDRAQNELHRLMKRAA